MAKPRKKLIILDGNSLLHRAWHAMPPLTTKDGTVVNAAYGFSLAIDKILREQKPEYMAVAWDLPGKTFRHEAVETYKATRTKQPQELYDQIPICQEVLDGYGIVSLSAEGFEADDVIGTVSAMEDQQDFDTLIVTGDLDSLQLVDDNTRVLFFVKGLSQTKVYDIEAVKERYGFGPEHIVDFKSLKGDSSDNIKGVPGVGDKTATTLITEFGHLEDMYARIEKAHKDCGGDFDTCGKEVEGIKTKLAQKLLDHKDDAEESKMLATIIRDIDLDFSIDEAELPEPNREVLLDLYRGLEFRTLIRRLSEVEAPPYEGEGAPTPPEKKQKQAKFDVVQGNADALWKSLKESVCAVHVVSQEEDLFGTTVGAILVHVKKKTHILLQPDQATCKAALNALVEAKEVVCHDWKALLHALEADPHALPAPKVFDLMLASYLLNSGSRSHDLPSILSDQLGESIENLPASIHSVKEQKVYARVLGQMEDVRSELEAQLEGEEMRTLFEEVEMPLASVLFKMEVDGILLDTEYMQALHDRFEKEINRLTKTIHQLAGREFNIASPTQLQEILFTDLGLPTKGIKKTKTGLSTAASELEKLWDAHEIIPLVSEYREVTKLQSTYVDALPALVGKDGRIHTDFNQTVAATGRLSSSNPNLQNIPIRTELGREIRKAFVAKRGCTLVAADYSQVELRMAAVIAKDPAFIQAFKEGADIHTRTAATVLGKKDQDVTKEERYAAKAINFGILYGMGPRALARQTKMSFKEAKAFIEKYFEAHPAIRQYIDETKILVRKQGYVETLLGRRRFLPEIETGVPMLVAQAERMAVNMPLQGTVADILKKAMIEVQSWIEATYPDGDVRMLLQVHDELIFEVKSGLVREVQEKVRTIMEGVVNFEIPLKVDVGDGKNWGAMK